MDREQAAGTLELLRKVVAQARDDTALENWGIIWLLSAFSNTAGFEGTQYLFSTDHKTPWPYVGMWLGVLTVNGIVIAIFKEKPKGNRSFIERQIWSIWNTCIVALGLAAIVNYLIGLTTLFMPAVACIIVAMTFSMMGAIMGAWWYLPAGVWAAMSLVIAALPSLQFALFGGIWFVTQATSGAFLHRARLRKLRGETP
ncbi:MAG: hypothetical protein U0165_10100 [Polyangiaceae bacterium]